MAEIRLENINKQFKSAYYKSNKSTNILLSFAMLKSTNALTYKMITDELNRMDKKDINNKNLFSIKNINLVIPHGKTLVILGPSGCGKSTLLRIIAGLLPVDSGNIYYDDIIINSIEPKDRKIGIVFQNYALYPHFSSKKNILSYFFFKKKTPDLEEIKKEKYEKTSELMGVDIEYLLDRKPMNLSGGEKQRIAIARCITREPSLFLLDEPFSNLDQKLREKYRLNLKKLLNNFDVTTIYVTHDQQEALILADIIAVMNDGKIEQIGTYEEIYNNPKNVFIAEFLNLDQDTPSINLIDGKHILDKYCNILVGIRPENIEICNKQKKDDIVIEAEILNTRKIPVKNMTLINAKISNDEIYFKTDLNINFVIGSKIKIKLKKLHLFKKSNQI